MWPEITLTKVSGSEYQSLDEESWVKGDRVLHLSLLNFAVTECFPQLIIRVVPFKRMLGLLEMVLLRFFLTGRLVEISVLAEERQIKSDTMPYCRRQL